MMMLFVKLQNRMCSEKGQGMVEYSLIIGLIAIVLIGVLTAFTGPGGLTAIFTHITTEIGLTAIH